MRCVEGGRGRIDEVNESVCQIMAADGSVSNESGASMDIIKALAHLSASAGGAGGSFMVYCVSVIERGARDE